MYAYDTFPSFLEELLPEGYNLKARWERVFGQSLGFSKKAK